MEQDSGGLMQAILLPRLSRAATTSRSCVLKSAVGLLLLLSATMPANAADSICYGTPADGRIERAVQLPRRGGNFRAYNSVGVSLGRTYVHARVADTTVSAYAKLMHSARGKIFVYGETGFAKGGRFKPHRTDQNGLSVDFMVPVIGGRHARLRRR
jgi:penicillin-insensitive murein DD-endopeptidase